MKDAVTVTGIETIDVILVGEPTIREAQEHITACENCAENAVVPFDYVLDAVTGFEPTVTTYFMCRLAKCPSCSSSVTEKTLIL